MFVVTSLVDVIRIPPSLLGGSCRSAIISEIDHKYPNRVLLDHGLVVCRYGEVRQISNGVCVAGDGGSHHTCAFSLVLFRPFLEEVVVGRIARSTAEGVHVTLGFFDDVFIPAYWMLRPSVYEPDLGLWVWTPQYDDDDDDDDGGEKGENGGGNGESNKATKEPSTEEPQRYEMVLHAEIRFKVKSIQYTQLTKTAKGLQATTTTDDSSGGGAMVPTSAPTATTSASSSSSTTGLTSLTADPLALGPIRRQRSSTMDDHMGSAAAASASASPSSKGQSPMYIIGSICEDGLGLTSWWTNSEDADDDADGDGGEEDVDEGHSGDDDDDVEG